MKKTAKRLILMLLVLALLASAVPMALMSSAVEWTDSTGLIWTIDTSKRVTAVTGDFQDRTTLTFPPASQANQVGSGNGATAWGIPESVKKIVIPDGYTKLNNYAFQNLKVNQIQLPDTITSIGNYAFKNCTNLKQFRAPSEITSLNSNYFTDCKALVSFDFNNVKPTTILAGQTNLEFIYINESGGTANLGASSADNMIGNPEKGVTVVFGDEYKTATNSQLLKYCYIKEIVWPKELTCPSGAQFFYNTVFVDGVANFENLTSNKSSQQFTGFKIRPKNGKANIYIGENIKFDITSNDTREPRLFVWCSLENNGVTPAVYLAGDSDRLVGKVNGELFGENKKWTVGTTGVPNTDNFKMIKIDNFTGECEPILNTPYVYKYNNTNFDEWRLPPTPPENKNYGGKDEAGKNIWVDEAVLAVKSQLPAGVDEQTQSTSIRFLSTVNSLEYEAAATF